MKKILVLGAGLVSRPLVRYLLERPEFSVTVASRTVSKADALVAGHPRGRAVPLSSHDADRLGKLVSEHDLAVSLLPAPLHPAVAKACVQHGKHMVTTSYVSPAMTKLDDPARDAGVLLLNEIGVDPGIDHMSAMRIVHAVQGRGGVVFSFKSYCGGLPAPEANTNPWGYKFSWSPRAVCTAGKNPGLYLEHGKKVHVPAARLFGHVHRVGVNGLGELEAYPNRNALGYIDLYGLKGIETMFRGTFRYPGWCETMKAVVEFGLLDETPVTYPAGTTFANWMAGILHVPPTGNLREEIATRLGPGESAAIIRRFEWLGLLTDDPVPITDAETTRLDVLAARMHEKMPYAPGERDMIVLCHHFAARFPSGAQERITSTLIDYGQPGGDSSMARTVSLPAAIAAALILDGRIDLSGVHIPVQQSIYEPVLDELERLGIRCVERTEAGGMLSPQA